MLNFINNLGPQELGIIILVVVLLFGRKLLVNFAKTTGETTREVKKLKKTFMETVNGDLEVKSRKEV